MNNEDKIFLTILYIIISIIFVCYIVYKIRKRKSMVAIDYFNIYYLLVYFLVPIFFFFNSYSAFSRKYAVFLEYDFRYHIISLLCAVVFIVLVNFFYNKLKIRLHFNRKIDVGTRKFLLLNIVFSLIGIFSYYMWTKAYGFPFGIIKYADLLRDNITVLDNPYTFFQPFSNFVIFAAYNWLVLFKSYRKIINRALVLIMFAVTFFFSVLAVLATDSRFSIIILFLVPVLFFINIKKDNLKMIILFGMVAIFALGKIDSITSNLRGETYKKAEANNAFELLSYEFGFTYANRVNLFYNIEHEDVKITEAEDLKNVTMSWLPKSLRPEGFQQLGNYNTTLYKNPSGSIPTDIVTAAIYKGRFLGLIFLALFIAFILKIFDACFANKKDYFTRMFYLYFCVAVMLRIVAYYDLSSLLYERFAFIIYYLIMFMLCRGDVEEDRLLLQGKEIVK